MSSRHSIFRCTVLLALCCQTALSRAQGYTSLERDLVQSMLRDISSDVKKHYYDPNFHGIDWDAKVREAEAKIGSSDSWNVALSDIADALDNLHDSHTLFWPPARPEVPDYGFEMQMIGDRCYVIRVRPGSDAEAKGLKAGDEILTVNRYAFARDDFWKIDYLYKVLSPQSGLRLELRAVNGNKGQVDVMAKLVERPHGDITGHAPVTRAIENEVHLNRVRYAEKGDGLLIVKLPVFLLSLSEVESVVGKMRKHSGVLLDLRGNPGGREDTLQFLLGGLFENNVKIGDRQDRVSTRPVEARPRHHAFTGKLVVLIDSKSGSASELLARVVQIEKRGSVVGDHSSGSVMEAKHYYHRTGTGTIFVYGASITEADFKMSDGQSLEHKGVSPDTLLLPTSTDLANGRDPVIAFAAEMLAVKITPEEGGALFPYEWPKE
jgi:C-terminal processing protease CtpA/Prc